MQLKKGNLLIAKNYPLNILLMVIFFSILNYYLLIDFIRLLCTSFIIS